jgi:hypothetical protein
LNRETFLKYKAENRPAPAMEELLKRAERDHARTRSAMIPPGKPPNMLSQVLGFSGAERAKAKVVPTTPKHAKNEIFWFFEH